MLQSEDISDKNFAFTLYFDNIGDLDDWVGLRSWELACLCGTLNVETEDTQRCQLRVFTFAWETSQVVVVVDVEFNLTFGALSACVADSPISRVNSNPTHASKVVVNHEAQSKGHV